jgi:hypothetical protein
MGSRRLHSGRREEIWARWRSHREAQRASGQTQVAYCRRHGLDPRHFSVWKSKLKRAEGTAPAANGPTKGSGLRMVPVVIRSGSGAGVVSHVGAPEPLTIHLQLSNGLSVSMTLAGVGRLPSVLEHLARTAC